ncbi:MAG: YraN family protein [Bacteroidales bacterium]|nr:YraN family protein [Bacteroidales bacterium]HPO64592.1 YraN family protein [Bacteroidales bacterium]
MEKNNIGNTGETLAAEYLVGKGYKILARNWQCFRRELDIVAQYNNTYVFVEVRTRRFGGMLTPSESVTLKKQRLLVEAANLYLQQKGLDGESRFDVICISYEYGKTVIEHIENAFYPPVKK